MAVRRQQVAPRRLPRRVPLLVPLLVGAVLLLGANTVFRRGQTTPSSDHGTVFVGEYDIVEVPVPSEPLAPGTKIRSATFRNVAYPRHQIPNGAITDLAPYIEAVTTQALPASLPMFKENLSFTGMGKNPVVDRIPQGMRAMTVRVDATSAVEGWATSGSMVDVLLVQNNRTAVVAEQVKVLSLERSVSELDGTTSPSTPSTATLLVTQEQCLAINTAIPLGKIAFALRSTNDDKNWDDATYTADQLRGDPKRRKDVSGYVSIQGRESFAFVDGKWIRTEAKPEGFLASQPE